MCERGGEAHAACARKLADGDAPVAYLILVVRSNAWQWVSKPTPSEGLPGPHSEQGGRRAPVAVRATSALAGHSSVKRVAAQPKERTRKREDRGNQGKISEKKRRASAATTFSKKPVTSEIRVVPKERKRGL